MSHLALIAFGYAMLILTTGPVGLLVGVVHMGLMLGAAWLRGRLRNRIPPR